MTPSPSYPILIPPFDPEQAAQDPVYWEEHAQEDLELLYFRQAERAYAMIERHQFKGAMQ